MNSKKKKKANSPKSSLEKEVCMLGGGGKLPARDVTTPPGPRTGAGKEKGAVMGKKRPQCQGEHPGGNPGLGCREMSVQSHQMGLLSNWKLERILLLNTRKKGKPGAPKDR